MVTDPHVDGYIAAQADFAQAILRHLRKAVHASCTEAVETLKWGMPAFMYKGEILATMAGFKAHASFAFWRGSLVVGEEHVRSGAMCQFGRLTSVDDLPPPDVLAQLIVRAVALAASGAKPSRKKMRNEPLQIPPDLEAALKNDAAASATFQAFPLSSRRDYVDWVTEAKRPTTRANRIAEAVAWMAEGKRRNWKFEKR